VVVLTKGGSNIGVGEEMTGTLLAFIRDFENDCLNVGAPGIYLVTVVGNAGGFATVRNSSYAGCPSAYSPYVSTFDASGQPADENFYFAYIGN
jgi:hypothetical protein